MTREEFDALVTRLDRRLGKRPGRLKLELVLCACLAFALMFAWTGLLLLIAAFFIVVTFVGGVNDGGAFFVFMGLACLFLFLAGRSLMALMIRLEPPQGTRLKRAEAPELFDVIEEVRRQLGCRPFHEVVLTPDFNASACYTPRLGFLGWARHSLVLGLPFLECLSVEQVKSIIAHEFTHMAGGHAAFSNWIYRQRRIWEALMAKFEQRAVLQQGFSLSRPFLKGFQWFWPRFHARAFLLSRANEYEADRNAAKAAGTEQAGQALWRTGVFGERLDEEFWHELWREATTSAVPPRDGMQRLTSTLSGSPDPEAAIRWKERGCMELTGHLDTHPSLPDRLRGLGLAVREFALAAFPLAASPAAAQTLLGASLPALRESLQSEWERKLLPMWKERHAVASHRQHQLQRMETHTEGPLSTSPEVLWERARLLLDVDGASAAEPLLRQLLSLQPGHTRAALHLGSILLKRRPGEGEAMLRGLLDSEDTVSASGEMLMQHYIKTGQDEQRRELQARLDRLEKLYQEAAREESSLKANDAFTAEGLAECDLSLVVSALREAGVAQAWLARKVIKAMPSRRVFVLVVTTRRGWMDRGAAARDDVIVRSLTRSISLPGRFIVTHPASALSGVAKAACRKGLPLLQS